MKQISILIIGFAAALACAPALAEDFTAGKTPAQLFRSDCATCHHSPNGLLKRRSNAGDLTAFLREHYTTKSETAAALAAYVSGFAPGPGKDHNPTRNRIGADTTAATEDTRADEPRGHRRRGREIASVQAGKTGGRKVRRHRPAADDSRTAAPDGEPAEVPGQARPGAASETAPEGAPAADAPH